MSTNDTYGPAVVLCPYCSDEVSVDAGPTRRCEIKHDSDCKWMVVDLVDEAAGTTSHQGDAQ